MQKIQNTQPKSTTQRVITPEQRAKLEDQFTKFKLCTEHLYLAKKGAKAPPGLFRQKDNQIHGPELIVPFFTLEQKAKNGPVNRVGFGGWQAISANGEKKNLAGYPIKNAFLDIGGLNVKSERIYIAEGISTALSIYEITGEPCYCSFGKNNLEIVILYALKTGQIVVLCRDNDGKNTWKVPEKLLKYKNFIVLTPDKRGDFNDFREDPLEKKKLLTLKKPLFYSYKGKVLPQTFFDEHGLIPNHTSILLTGKTGSLKSTGFFTYMLDQAKDRPIAYFSDERSDSPVIGNARALKKEHLLLRMPFDEFTPKERKELETQLLEAGPDDKPAGIFLDPPPVIQGGTIAEEGVRQELKKYRIMAEKTLIFNALTRNYSKGEKEKDELEKIAGSASFYNTPRFILVTKLCDIGSRFRPKKEDPKTSILFCLKNSEGAMPKKALKLTLEPISIASDIEGQMRSQGIVKVTPFLFDKPFDYYTRPINNQANEDKKARLFIPLLKEPMLRSEWMDLNKDRVSPATLKIYLAEAVEKGYVEKVKTGEGKTGRKIELRLTAKGFKFYGGLNLLAY